MRSDYQENDNMLNNTEIQSILDHFGLSFQSVTNYYDTSHGDDDIRLNYILDDRYVLKVNSAGVMGEERLQQISRLIGRYRGIGVYCPGMIPTEEGPLSLEWEKTEEAISAMWKNLLSIPFMTGIRTMTAGRSLSIWGSWQSGTQV